MKKKSLHKPFLCKEGFKRSAIVFFLSIMFVLSNQSVVRAASGNQDKQDRTISGVVTDLQGLSLPGVNVYISGTSLGTTTDIDGKYTINQLQDGQTLIFSFIGMISQE